MGGCLDPFARNKLTQNKELDADCRVRPAAPLATAAKKISSVVNTQVEFIRK